MRNELLKKTRFLTQLLIFSGATNLVLAAYVFYWTINERPPIPICEGKPQSIIENQKVSVATNLNQQVIQSFEKKPLKEIYSNDLSNKQLLDNGFTQRDLALGYLISHYHLDFERALNGKHPPKEKRYMSYLSNAASRKKLATYTDLSDSHFEAVKEFISKERWPFTSQGLYHLLQQQREAPEKSLKYAFYLTPEFRSLLLLFTRSIQEHSREELLNMVLEGPWQLLEDFFEKQRISQNHSDAERQHLLVSYLKNGSITSSELLLKSDFYYVVKKLDDQQVIALLALSKKATPNSARFALAMLASPRSDRVWKAAALRLYQYTGQKAPASLDRNAALARFLPVAKQKNEEKKVAVAPGINSSFKPLTHAKVNIPPTPIKKIPPAKKPWKRGYTVMEGDTLWKIARLFHVDVKELKARNPSISHELKPGTMIMVP